MTAERGREVLQGLRIDGLSMFATRSPYGRLPHPREVAPRLRNGGKGTMVETYFQELSADELEEMQGRKRVGDDDDWKPSRPRGRGQQTTKQALVASLAARASKEIKQKVGDARGLDYLQGALVHLVTHFRWKGLREDLQRRRTRVARVDDAVAGAAGDDIGTMDISVDGGNVAARGDAAVVEEDMYD